MKIYHFYAVMIVVLLCFRAGWVSAQQEVPPEPRVTRPPLVECTQGQDAPCSQIVDDVSDIVGIWRGYSDGAKAMNFTVFAEGGSIGTASAPQAEPTFAGSITFANELAFITANPGSAVPVECVTASVYVMRLIRMGEHPVALTYRPLIKDNCIERAADLSEPMLAYPGMSEALTQLDANLNALAQPLVPCPTEETQNAQVYPCDVVATQPTDFAGIWTQYVVPPLTGVAFFRYNNDGSWALAGTPEDTGAASTSFAVGTVELNQALITLHEPGDTPECITADYYLHVIQWGNQPVALSYTPIKDNCAVRRSAWVDPMIWIKGT